VAMPMLEAALSALDTLTKADMTELKSMKNPPAGKILLDKAKYRRWPHGYAGV
jgi:dynein heavy chain, axonemal